MDYITLALAKGRTAKDTFKLLETAGIYFNDFHEKSRKLVFYNDDQSLKLIFVKAVDVPTYVEKGAADIGIVGKDNILEAQADVYEMLDLKLGKCKFVVAGKYPESDPEKKRNLTIASKYPTIAKKHFEKKGTSIETVKLNGAVELAPLIGLSDMIVDIVETGNTIDENGLTIFEEIESISTRLIVNKASFATKSASINLFINNLKSALE
ncbi:ATP phosphoribosyltransferase [Virgibacillus natechei]|uniref:ATP phosphoribosyltransferase n=1 Tax=Virgibacillus natechei TaxID=1216297 RepID=A0ABS4IDX8_9BACI|nr:ATP phosphoribosyltransferase [Virgibacillus natechei]MBP1968541.1 ATP phosphoribosyltransferase [Virgibacillus natechei]UZD13656.1 ATP phosphoribosyltransferase [Virgibacillus natechei]